jgi:ABC-type Na+ efflux pump permease subunit
LDITPILNRELLVVTRKRQLWAGRVWTASILLGIGLATFGARYNWDEGKVARHDMMARVAFEAYLWIVLAHMALIFAVVVARAAPSIADEKDRRTLDFLLATRLSNAEIILGKLAACVYFLTVEFAVGLPISLLLHAVGGIDLRLILLGYAGLATTGFFMIALAVWISSGAINNRLAAAGFILWWVAWLMGPFFVSFVFPGLGVRLPRFLLTVNAWVLTSGPFGLLLKIGGGIRPSSGLAEAVAWMSGLQIVGGTLLVIWAIARLRSSYRRNISVDSQSLAARLSRPGWRWRPKPPVGDDPILWREMNLSRGGLISKSFGFLILLGMYSALAYVTYFFTRPALVEVWQHGYTAGITSAETPEWNLAIRYFMSGYDVNPPSDVARTELNVYLRNVTTPLLFLIALVTAGMASEGITSERARETWDSLIATPLTARDILRSKMLAALWRMRALVATLLGLWAIGLVAGAIHPIGFLAAVLGLTSLIWLMLTFGVFISIGAKDAAATTGPTMGLIFMLTGSGALPLLLPARWSSVILGAGSPPFVSFLSLVSYRDVRNAWHYPAFPFLQWIHLATGEGPLPVVATCLLGVVLPAFVGSYFWRFSVNNFDRLIDRPVKIPAEVAEHLALAPAPAT